MTVITVLLVLLVGLATAKDWWVKDQQQRKEEQAPDGYAHLEPEVSQNSVGLVVVQ